MIWKHYRIVITVNLVLSDCYSLRLIIVKINVKCYHLIQIDHRHVFQHKNTCPFMFMYEKQTKNNQKNEKKSWAHSESKLKPSYFKKYFLLFVSEVSAFISWVEKNIWLDKIFVLMFFNTKQFSCSKQVATYGEIHCNCKWSCQTTLGQATFAIAGWLTGWFAANSTKSTST